MAHVLQAKSFRDLVGVPRSTASPLDSTLIIIDAQNEYAEGHLTTANVSSTRRAIADLLATYRKSAPTPASVVHVTHVVPDGAPVFTPGTRLADEFDELKPAEGEKIIHKEHPGSFTGTDLKEHLDGLDGGIGKKVVLTGYMAHVCVSTTARQAAELGLDVILAREAIGDRDIPGGRADDVVNMTLSELGDAFGTVLPVHEIK